MSIREVEFDPLTGVKNTITYRDDGKVEITRSQDLEPMLKLAERHVIVEKGHVVWTGTSDQLANDANIRQQYLMV